VDRINPVPRPHPALSFGRPQVFAHRGGAALRPENTIASFDNGLALGADGLEFDVHLSRDGVVVVHHDRTLERTTNGLGLLADRTASELAALDAGWNFGAPDHSFRGQVGGLPALSTVLRRYRDVPMIVELKANDPVLAHRTIDEIRAADAVERIALGSFGTRVLRAARTYEPRIVTGSSREETRLALYRSWVWWPVRRPRYDVFQVPEFAGMTRVVSPRFIRYAHEAGVAVQVWTVDRAADMQRLLDWGADGIISDRPDVAVDVVRAFAQSRSAGHAP
jgi:glycerophosphoryl diester phosphodiesterase